jgi:colanic acid biosynthesis glycosyl transferase WcaI
VRILLVTQWFDPEPTFKGLLFAKKLRELGHEVEVLTGFPNYPGGKLYPGFRQSWRRRETIDGVQLTRVPLHTSHDGSAIGRVLNYASFAASATLYGIFFARKADLIYVYHPPITAGMAAALIGLFRRTRFVLDVQDLWPDTLRSTGMLNNERLLGWAAKACDWTYRRASHIVVLSPGFHAALRARGVPAQKLTTIYNWCDEAAMREAAPASIDLAPLDGRFNVVFAGNMGKAQALDAVIRAATMVAGQDRWVQFVLVGGGVEVEALKALARELGADNVLFLPRLPMAEIGSVLARADVLLVHLKDDALFKITIPSKTQAYMAVGKPILMAVGGDAADLVAEAGAGAVARPEDPASIAAAVLQLARLSAQQRADMGARAAQFYRDNLSLDIGAKKFSDLFARLVAKRDTQ